MNQPEQAVQLFLNGTNCSQAILTVFGASYGLDQELAHSLGRSLGGGLGRMGQTCGAVTGALLILGLAQGNPENEAEAKSELAAAIKELSKKFVTCHGSLSCRDLLQADISTESGLKKIKEERLLAKVCPAFIKDASEILVDLINREKSTMGNQSN